MAVDFDAALATGYAVSEKVDELMSLIRLAKEGKVDGGRLGGINLTTAQKQTLVSDYTTVKSALQAEYQKLP